MRLSKQERIAVLIIAVIIILGLGAFLFIVPQFQNIGKDSAELVNKQVELKKAQDKAATKEKLAEDILDAYDEGKDKADMFFEEMKPYQADNEVREFLDYCDKNDVNVFVDSITIGEPTVSSLSVSFYKVPEINYALKTAAKGDSNEETDEEKRLAILQDQLSNTQAVGSIDVTFNVTTLNDEDMLKFIDMINNYKKDSVRKAIRLSSAFEIEFQDIMEKYQKVIQDMQVDLVFDARTQLANDTKTDKPNRDEIEEQYGNKDEQNAQGAEGENNNNKKENVAEFEDNVEQLTVTVTLYSLERMQDPTDTLAAQE